VADWLEHSALPAAIAAAVLLLVLWPTTHSGRRLLRTWGIPDPRPDQVGEAVRYLRRRRLLYVVVFLVLPSLTGLVIRSDTPGVGLFVPLLAAMLVAELIATLRPVGGVRVASLAPRGWRDLVPPWAVRTMAAMAVVAAALAVLGCTRERPLPGAQPTSSFALGYLVVCLVVVGLLVHLAVRRPAVADEEVDAALRTRTARVAVGIGFGWVGTAVNIAAQRVNALEVVGRMRSEPGGLADAMQVTGLVALVLGIVCWLWVAIPGGRSLTRR
jgi:hypothetical protein